MRELDQLEQSADTPGLQFLGINGLAQLGRTIDGKDQLGVHGKLRPERPVVVEYRDPIDLRDESI